MTAGERNGSAGALPGPGHLIGGKYEILRVIGEGGMGVVFEAKHLKLHQRVAVKMLLPDMLSHPVILSRFEREARASGQLRNRHTARVMDVDVTAEGLPYMVMEFLEGHDLQTELDVRERLPVDEAIDYVLQACSAMAEAHQLGIVHRDLKPANLFLALDSNSNDASAGRIVKVLDFGISKLQADGDVKLTVAETVIGTAMYMSPEQIRSSGTVDARTDIWSLGIILYELVAGRPPWIGSPTQLAAMIVSEDVPDVRTYADVPEAVAAVITKALMRDPRERFADVRQLAHALTPFAGAGRAGASSARLLGASVVPGPMVTARPPGLADANTLLQAPAISESRLGGGAGTTPGWTQSGQSTARGRTLLLGFLGAFVVGLVLVGGLAMFLVRTQAGPNATASAPRSSSPPTLASSAPASSVAATAELPPSVLAAPVPVAPSASSASAASASAAPSSSAAPRPRVVPHLPSTGAAPRPPPPAAATSNPIHL